MPMYELNNERRKDLSNRFSYHPPWGGQADKYKQLRELAADFAGALCQFVPESRELSLALTNLEQAVMWANAGIARNEKPPADHLECHR